MFWWDRCAAIVFEPQQGRAEDAAVSELVAHAGLNGPEVLADHERACALRLEREDAEHRFGVVPHIGAGRRTRPGGNPPEPEQAEDVVDAKTAGMTEDRGDKIAMGRVPRRSEPVRPHRRLLPVLPLLVEPI